MTSGGNRKPLNAELGTAGTERPRDRSIPPRSPPDTGITQCNRALGYQRGQRHVFFFLFVIGFAGVNLVHEGLAAVGATPI